MSAVMKQYPSDLRPLREEDLDEIMVIEAQSYEFPWTRGIFMDCLRVGYPGWVYEAQGRIQGYTVLSVAAGESHILNLCVHPLYRGLGIGAILLQGALETARRLGAVQILLEVRPSNISALRLYHHYGFNEIGVRKNYYPAKRGREDAHILARAIID
jgi:ribosomal-protein-alanine N-acetyltransferase